MSEQRRNWVVGIVFLILCGAMVLMSLTTVMQQVQISHLSKQVEKQQSAIETFLDFSKDQMIINEAIREELRRAANENQ
jgi:hypothetical protein